MCYVYYSFYCVCFGEGGMIITIIRLAEQPKTQTAAAASKQQL